MAEPYTTDTAMLTPEEIIEANPTRHISEADYEQLRSTYPELHPTTPKFAPAELTYTPDQTSWTARENLTDIISREILGPRAGEQEVITEPPDQTYFVGRIAPCKLDPNRPKGVAAHSTLDGDPTGGDYYTHADANLGQGIPALQNDAQEADCDQDSVDDQPQRRGLMIPASMGLRFMIDTRVTSSFTVHASWAQYKRSTIPRPVENVDTTHKRRTNSKRKHDKIPVYTRTPHTVSTTIHVDNIRNNAHEVADHDGITRLVDQIVLRIDRYNIPNTDRAIIEVALCNDYETPERIDTERWLFQTQLHIETETGDYEFLPIKDPTETRPGGSDYFQDFEVESLELLYRNRLEYATGRTCSATWLADAKTRRAKQVSTTWLPTHEVPQVQAESSNDVTLDMKVLADERLRDDPDNTQAINKLVNGLRPLVDGYTTWLNREAARGEKLPSHLQETLEESVSRAEQIRDGLNAGIDELATNADARQAFWFMNECMAEQRIHSQIAEKRSTGAKLTMAEARAQVLEGDYPHSWRMFQLAFILLNIPAMSHPDHNDRASDSAAVNLLFFPTGGGKTEAYLGLAAFTFAIRRIQGELNTPEGPLDGTTGVAVLMRYTLRLLTAQQFQRATTLICAAENIRQQDEDLWGDEPFRIGLWVGSNVTPKTFDEAKQQLEDSDGRTDRITVLQLQVCPWCGETLTEKSVSLDTVTRRVHIYCSNDLDGCPFAKGQSKNPGHDEGIPVVTTDEEIYRLIPAFIVATVDKFARLAREGAAASLFGYVGQYCERHGYVHADSNACNLTNGKHRRSGKHPDAQSHKCNRCRPIDLIIQDELHLITGALGTTVGLFETAVDVATTWTTPDGTTAKPLIVASTATVRNASKQVQHLFGRQVQVFPPQVLDVNETYFSTEIPVSQKTPGRRYLGVSTTGVRLSTAEMRLTSVILSAAQHILDTHGHKPADPYMTLVGYFNTTRELGGYARYLKSDISTNLRRSSHSGLPRRLWGLSNELETTELTSRVSGSDIGKSLRDLTISFDEHASSSGRQLTMDQLFAEKDKAKTAGTTQNTKQPNYEPKRRPADVVMATSMLQVGVDVTRLGLMMIIGQPKNTAEYIQASSRVGRDAKKPGLVIALGNWARPRDLAHYEQFRHYHDTFYAQVEALSITPFSTTSLDRGLAGAVISAARVLTAASTNGLSANTDASNTDANSDFLTKLVDSLHTRITQADDTGIAADNAKDRLHNILERWNLQRDNAKKLNRTLSYTATERQSQTLKPLIEDAESHGFARSGDGDKGFAVANSMREVQPDIAVLVSPLAEKLTYIEPDDAPAWKFIPKDNS